MEYQRLGNYIRPVDVRNRDLKVNLSQGICNAKYFQNPKQVADNPETHKVVRTGQFAYNRATTRNGEKISIALREGPDCTVSSAYQVFEIVDENLLHPKYLMMWFKRPEFDRLAIFYSHGSAHEFFEWDAMCEVRLPVPSIARQREIVEEYETLSRRIRLNEQMIASLEETAQALYRKMFVDGIDKGNLPEGWRRGKLSEIASITMGQSPEGETYNLDGQGMIFYQGRTDFGRRFPTARVYTTSPTRYAKEGDVLLSVRAPVGDLNVASHDCCIGRGLASLRSKDGCQSYLFYQLQELGPVFSVSDDDGTVFGSINKDDLHCIEVVVPALQEMKVFEEYASVIDKQIGLKDKEINNLTELQSLLLARMGK
jgi:type I restriction enzyme S subunit